MLEFFKLYHRLGWKVIPLKEDSKLPFTKGWNKDYNHSSSEKFFRSGNYNIGLCLGEIIDVESDDPHKDEVINKLTKDIKHPKYRSNKSTHHLFLSPANITRIVIDDIEFRGHLHQSVLPPSTVSGTKYIWIDAADFAVPALPTCLKDLVYKKDNYVEPVCSACSRASRPIHHNRYSKELKAFATLGQKWQCHECRENIKNVCRKIKFKLK